jgi:hypothetical protein
MTPFLRDYIPYVYAGWAFLVCIYFLSAPTQNLRTFLTTLILAGFVAFGIHELRRQSEEEFPDVQVGDYFGGAKDRVVGAVKNANLGERASKLRLPEMRKPDGGGEGEAPQGTPDAAAAASGGDEDSRIGRLERLAELREKGVLSDEEFAAEKARVLGDGNS